MITRQDLQCWIEQYRVQLTAEAIDALLALGSEPVPAERSGSAAMSARSLTGLSEALRAAHLREVSDEQVRAFAGYLEGWPETVWYRAIPDAPWDGEFEALRALATDLLALRAVCRLLQPLVRVFAAAVTYRDCWTPRARMSVNQAARGLADAVRQAETEISTDRDVHGPGPRR
jgi:hypothetical protein